MTDTIARRARRQTAVAIGAARTCNLGMPRERPLFPEHPLVRLIARLERAEAIVAGVLSGTSADGISVALLRFGVPGTAIGKPVPLAFHTRPFPAALALELRGVLDGQALDARGVALLGRDLGHAFGMAAAELARAHGLELDLVGSHGQTVYHHDGVEARGPATLQLGDGDFVAHAAGAVTASDFRLADLASGGEGAPLSALLEGELFPDLPRPAAILNLGGIANVTYLGPGGETLAFDVGPANCLLDGLARELLGRPFDPEGETARAGRASEVLLAEFLAHPFFERRPPRSTGRDTFGAPYVARFLARARALDLGPPDVLATATAFVAQSVAGALRRWLPLPPRELVLCGGGAFNATLARELAHRTGLRTSTSASHGVPPEAREATFFAHLAVRCVLARPSTDPRATGARRGAVLGKLSWPPHAVSPELSRSQPRKLG
jgi:anhydro-N-acetylmuramic acid kinase